MKEYYKIIKPIANTEYPLGFVLTASTNLKSDGVLIYVGDRYVLHSWHKIAQMVREGILEQLDEHPAMEY